MRSVATHEKGHATGWVLTSTESRKSRIATVARATSKSSEARTVAGRSLRTLAVGLAFFAVGSAAAPLTNATAADSRSRLTVVAGERSARLSPGSRCLTRQADAPGSDETLLCTSQRYDPTPRRLFRVSPRATIVMCAGSPATRMNLALVRDRAAGPRQLAAKRASKLDRSGQCWRVSLPNVLSSATSLDIRVDYGKRQFVHFIAGIDRR